MRLEEAIQRLDRSTAAPGTNESVKIRQRFSTILQELKYKNFPPEQLALVEHELELIFKDFNLEGNNAEKELRVHLKNFLKFLRTNFSLLPEGYCAMYGMRIGLTTGLILLLFLFFYTESSFKYYSPLGGLLLGVMLGSACDRWEKMKGRTLLTKIV
ncbi:hypothetical protein JRG66_14055 [Salinimicrobium tongyeongense]|uniref:Uncharacterized protein n=1 Tax=Salinimicrobium tongyeongense TaxID=2809707 RepID=A0ABY6NQ83_9FLAO|nr:hypothetical protein [Salinimicrobium tongyeongense]UZH55067.1 hypothetical protein JRG66_14055 [Salinimicrobium tongyeongense]